jgi:hypothetical protein
MAVEGVPAGHIDRRTVVSAGTEVRHNGLLDSGSETYSSCDSRIQRTGIDPSILAMSTLTDDYGEQYPPVDGPTVS